MTEDWIHYFDQPKYHVINAFEGQKDEMLRGQVHSFHSLQSVSWDELDIALIGVNDARNSQHKGCAQAPDKIRAYLMGLRALSKKLSIVDLGNIRGKTIDDRYKALEEVVSHLVKHRVVSIVIGGSQDYTLPLVKVSQLQAAGCNLAVVDSKLDWQAPDQDFSAVSFLDYMFSSESYRPTSLSVVGVQKYLFSRYQEDQVTEVADEVIRLGQIRQSGHRIVEPIMRDANLLSVDMTVVRQCDQPAHILPMPNGLTGEELCQLMWYAGQSDQINIFGIFELDVQLDQRSQGVVLGAQAIWYILEGIALRYNDYPVKDLDEYRQFIVYLEDYELDIKFYNNPDNDRWWVEIPGSNEGVVVIACGRNDFEAASANEIPEKWFRYFKKTGL
ncbi:arginase family protein [Carboxylicivirga taeanensis]|uniref:arginase family protein n=1 Tax=Carboxylicivirga taeanensis TaxID=1416875 RepID=UPI003F6E1E76